MSSEQGPSRQIVFLEPLAATFVTAALKLLKRHRHLPPHLPASRVGLL